MNQWKDCLSVSACQIKWKKCEAKRNNGYKRMVRMIEQMNEESIVLNSGRFVSLIVELWKSLVQISSRDSLMLQ